MKQQEMSMIYETLLMVPGMEERVKIDLRIPRKTVLLLVEILQKGIEDDQHKELLQLLNGNSDEALANISDIINHCLEKSGLTELNKQLLKMKD